MIINATLAGRATARSGLMPDTVFFLLKFVADRQPSLTKLLDSQIIAGPDDIPDIEKLNFAIIHACLDSPEFTGTQDQSQTRFIPYQLEKPIANNFAEQCESLLVYPYTYNKQRAANGALLAIMWINGHRPVELEKIFDAKLGSLRDTFNNVAWILMGLGDIISDVTAENLSSRSVLKLFQNSADLRRQVRRFSQYFKRLAYRLQTGLPDDIIWMAQAAESIREVRISRTEMLTLRLGNIISIQQAMDLDPNHASAFFRGPNAARKAIVFREHCRKWHQGMREKMKKKHLEHAQVPEQQNIIRNLYDSRGKEFEAVFERCLTTLGISFMRLDNKDVQGAPDYKISFAERPDLIVELKTKHNGSQCISLNEATDVLRASELHGYRNLFCLTVCNPNVDPGIITTIIKCTRLAVVELTDLAEAVLRLSHNNCTQAQVYDWLTQPGQALSSDLPFKRD